MVKITKESSVALLTEHWEKGVLGICVLLLLGCVALGLLAAPETDLQTLRQMAADVRQVVEKNPGNIGEISDYRKVVRGPWIPDTTGRSPQQAQFLDWIPYAIPPAHAFIVESKAAVEFTKPIKTKVLPTPLIESVTAELETGVAVQWKAETKLPPPNPETEEWVAPTHYFVERRVRGQKGEFEVVAKEVKESPWSDKETLPLTEYEYRVTAVTTDPTVKQGNNVGKPSEIKVVKTPSNYRVSFGGAPIPSPKEYDSAERPCTQITVSIYQDNVWHSGTITVPRVDKGKELKDKLVFEGSVLDGTIRCAGHTSGKSDGCQKSFEVKSGIKILKFEEVKGQTFVRRCSVCKKKILDGILPSPAWKITYKDPEGSEQTMWIGERGPVQFSVCQDCMKKQSPKPPSQPAPTEKKEPAPKEQPREHPKQAPEASPKKGNIEKK